MDLNLIMKNFMWMHGWKAYNKERIRKLCEEKKVNKPAAIKEWRTNSEFHYRNKNNFRK